MGVAHDVMQASTQLSTHLPSTGQQQNTLDQQQQADQQQQQNRHHPLYVSSHMGVGGVQMQPSVQPRVYFHSTGQQQQQQHQQDQQQRVRYPQLPFPRFAHLPPLAVVAPGGYTVVSPTSPPILPPELPTPFIDCQRSSFCTDSSSNSSNGKLYNFGQYSRQQQYGQQYPQQQYGQPAHPLAVCIGQPVEQQQQQQQQQEDPQQGKKGCCQCTLGWALYGLGWIFPLCWIAAIILPFLTKTQGDKRAAVASGVTLGVLAVVAVLVTVVVITVAAATPPVG